MNSISDRRHLHKGEFILQVYLAVTPGEAQEASSCFRTLAHVAYRIGPGSSLLRQNLLLQTSGGLLSVSDRDAPPIEDAGALCAAVARECGRRNYGGVLLDFEEPPRQDRLAFVQKLGQTLSAGRRSLFLPAAYAKAAPGAVSLVCTAVSGGNFTEYLRETARSRGGPGRVALDVQRLRMDFTLPARSGEGTPLSAEAFGALVRRETPSTFFSPDLCAKYFTYTQGGAAHFVLFDDAETLRQKLRIGAGLGCTAAFLMWPEVRDIAGAFRRWHQL